MKSVLFPSLLVLCILNAVGQTGKSSPDSIMVKAIPHRCWLLEEPKEFDVLSNNSISMTAGKGTDLHNPTNGSYYRNNAPKFLFAPDANFDFSARVKPGFQTIYDGGAILLYSDRDNWSKILLQYTAEKKSILGISVVKDKITDDAYVKIADGQEVYVRVTREGKVFKYYMSSDGKQWDLVRDFVYHKPASVKLGFYSQSPSGDGCRVEFSDISYKGTVK